MTVLGLELKCSQWDLINLRLHRFYHLHLTCSVTSVWREVEGQEAAGDKEALCSPLVCSNPRNEILCVSLIKAGACILRLLKQSQLLVRTEGVVLPWYPAENYVPAPQLAPFRRGNLWFLPISICLQLPIMAEAKKVRQMGLISPRKPAGGGGSRTSGSSYFPCPLCIHFQC